MHIIYHKNCNDGICSAALMAKYMGATKFFPCNYGNPFPFDPAGKDIAILDFSFPRDVLIAIKSQAKSLIVLDHHKTAEANCKGLDFAKFDMSKSGCMMTIDYIGGHNVDGRSQVISQYVQDRDLRVWGLHKSEEVSAALASYPKTIESWVKLLDRKVIDLIAEGESILRYQNTIIDDVCGGDVKYADIGGHNVTLVNTTVLVSEIGHNLCQGEPFAAMYYDVLDEGKRAFSLRSDENGVDVSEVAKKYGGGGHKNAAGFSIPLDIIDVLIRPL